MKTINRELILGILFSLLLHLLILLFFPVFLGRGRDDQSQVPSYPMVVSLQIGRDLNIGRVIDPPDNLSAPQERPVPLEKGPVSSPSHKNQNREASVEKLTPLPANPDPAIQAGLMEKSLSNIPDFSPPPESVSTMVKEGTGTEGFEDIPPIKGKTNIEEGRFSFLRGTEQQESVREEDTVSLENFLRDLQETIGRDLIYPPAARNRGVEGRIIMEVWVGRDGSLKAAGIRESSGSSILDRSALRLIRSLFPRNHDLDREFRVTLSIEYRLSS